MGGWLDDMAGLGLVHVGVNIGWCLRSDAEGRRTDGHREDINAETDTQTKRCRPPHEGWRERGAAHETRHTKSKTICKADKGAANAAR